MLYSKGAGIINPACYGGSEGPYYWNHKFNNELATESEYRCIDSLVMPQAPAVQHGARQQFGKDPDVIVVELYGNKSDSSGSIAYIRMRLRDPAHIVWDRYIDIGKFEQKKMTLLATQRVVVQQGSTAAYHNHAYFVITLRAAAGNPTYVIKVGPDSEGYLSVSYSLQTLTSLPTGTTYYYEGVIWYGFDYQRVYDMVSAAISEVGTEVQKLQDQVDSINNDVQNKFVCR